MIVEVEVKPYAKKEAVIRSADGRLKVLIKAKPVEGKANEALREVLAGHFKIPKSQIRILHGLKGRLKRVEILG